MPLLEIRSLSAGYGGQTVLRDVSLEVDQGEFIAVVGPNGHGKTTLMRAISGLVRPLSGQILLAGEALTGLRADQIAARGIVHVPQGDLLFPDMTVQENLRMGAFARGTPADHARLLDEVHALFPRLRDRRHQPASTLSGGERRMVGIGRGLMAGGQVLILDEPSLGLAPLLIDQIYQVVVQLGRSGRTVIVVEENASRIADHAHRLHLLDHGRFVWSGGGAEFLSSPEILSTYLGV